MPTEEQKTPELESVVVTQEMLDENPEMVDAGLKVGDTVEIPAPTENDLKAAEIHANAIAEGKTDEEATALVDAFYASIQPAQDASTVETTSTGGAPVDTTPDVVEDEPVEPVETDEQKVFEKLSVSTEGRTYAGKDVIEARWDGEKLVIKDVDNVEFTLSGEELEKFLG